MSRSFGKHAGVSLVEMAMVLLILSLLTRAAVQPMSSILKQRQHRQASVELDAIRQSLWAHVVRRGVLPCPVGEGGGFSHDASLDEPYCALHAGGVPARALALSGPTDEWGALLDPWNRRYQLVVSANRQSEHGLPEAPDWTTPGEPSRIGIGSMQADLIVCREAVSGHCPDSQTRASELSFVVFSVGEDASATGEQRENLDGDDVFVYRQPSVLEATAHDDLLLWGSAAETLYWMLRAGWLP